jgi:uncharacterized protein YcaQ
MLFWLWLSGQVMVAGRSGGQRLWDLPVRLLPPGVPRAPLPWSVVVLRAAERSLQALGVATSRQISNYFIRGDYPGLDTTLRRLERQGRILRCSIQEDGRRLPGSWYIHQEDLALAQSIAAGGWSGSTTLLSPFDNLISDRLRTRLLFGFEFRLEIYVPPSQRRFGYFAMPILQEDRLVGTIDAAKDPRTASLRIKAAVLRDGARLDIRGLAASLRSLASFVEVRGLDGAAALPQVVRRAIEAA